MIGSSRMIVISAVGAMALAAGSLVDRVVPEVMLRSTPSRGDRKRLLKNPSRYLPHQGARECGRRRHQLGLA
jgi:hypothetical protein